jgi:hypothetical protein
VIGNHVGDHYVTCARSLVGNEVRVPVRVHSSLVVSLHKACCKQITVGQLIE